MHSIDSKRRPEPNLGNARILKPRPAPMLADKRMSLSQSVVKKSWVGKNEVSKPGISDSQDSLGLIYVDMQQSVPTGRRGYNETQGNFYGNTNADDAEKSTLRNLMDVRAH